MRQEEREPTERAVPLRPWRLLIWWMTLPVAVIVLLAGAVEEPILLIPVFVLLALAWWQRDRWHLSKTERMTTIAIVLVVFAAFLMQRFTA